MNPVDFVEWLVSKKEDGFDSMTIDELVSAFIKEGRLREIGYPPYEEPK